MALYEVDIKCWDDLCVETKIVSTNPASINDDTIFYTFKDEDEIENHVNSIEKEIEVSDKESRMIELKNWLNSLIN